MQCPECLTEQPFARYCVVCGLRVIPQSSVVSPLDLPPDAAGIPHDVGVTGEFAFGRDQRPELVLQPSAWTYAMRLSVAGWLAFSAAIDVYAVFAVQDAIRQAAYPSAQVNQGGMTAGEALGRSQFAFDAVVAVLVAWLLVKAFLAVGAYSGRTTWVFYACLGLVAVNALLGLTNIAGIALDLARHADVSLRLVLLLVQATAAGLLGWMVLAVQRFGPWAARRKPASSV